MPRPSKYTEEKAAEILKAIASGVSREVAAASVGVSADTVTNWTKRYSGFSDLLKAADARFEMNHVSRIGVAAQNGHWQASAWILERKYSERWGKRERVDNTHTGKDGGPVATETIVTIRRVGGPSSAEIEAAAEAKDTTQDGDESPDDD